MLYLLIGAAGLLIGIILFILARKKEKLTVEEATEKYKQYIDELTEERQKEYESLLLSRRQLEHDCYLLEKQRLNEQARAQEAKVATERLLQSEHERARAELNGVKQLEEERMKNEFEAHERYLKQQLEFKKQQFQEDFDVLNECFQDELNAAKAELSVVKVELDEFQTKRAAVNEAIRREREIEEQEDFYSIDIPQADQEDIQLLQSLDLRLHNRDVIPKLVWELFIRRPCQEMIKRVTGGRKVGGIYKITYKKTGEAYIGKTTDFSTRWQNHCKTTIGLEGAARATLHNRMAKDGLWNYTFEILEEVDKEHQSAREAYYIDLYGTKNQLNMKSGDKNGTQ